jgi:hypothetical protein
MIRALWEKPISGQYGLINLSVAVKKGSSATHPCSHQLRQVCSAPESIWPAPSLASECVSPQLGPGGATLGTPTSDEETDTLVLYLYYNPSTGVGGEWYGALLKF